MTTRSALRFSACHCQSVIGLRAKYPRRTPLRNAARKYRSFLLIVAGLFPFVRFLPG